MSKDPKLDIIVSDEDVTANRRQPYVSPIIKEFGRIGSLTQAGSMGQPESVGMAMGMPTML